MVNDVVTYLFIQFIIYYFIKIAIFNLSKLQQKKKKKK